MKRVLIFVIVLCGMLLSSCEKEPNSESKREPYYVIYFVADVVNEAGEPIQGICSYPEGANFCGRSGYSDYKGHISAFAHISPDVSNIIFEDIDGEYNGGRYRKMTINIRDKMYGASNSLDKWGYVGSDVVDVGEVVMKSVEQ